MGRNVQTLKDAITGLYKNLSFKTLTREQQIEFKKISDLSTHLNFKMKQSILLNLEIQDKDIKKNNQNVKIIYEFYKKHSDEGTFQKQIIEHEKVEAPYLPPTAQDAQTIEDEIKKKK